MFTEYLFRFYGTIHFFRFFILKSYKDAKKINMDPKILKQTIINSAVFTILPSISILIGVISFIGLCGTIYLWRNLG